MPGNASADPVTPRRAVVLGGGGLTALAWLAGVLDELPPVLAEADRVVGTSAGAVLATRMLLLDPRLRGAGSDGLDEFAAELAGVRISTAVAARLVAAQLWPSRRHALLWLGRSARRARTTLTEDAFVDLVGRAVGGSGWPASLVVAAVDADSGRPAYFTPRSAVELRRAVAASSAMPGVLPTVRIEDRVFLDGGLRSPANADLASGCERVLILAPQGRSVREVRRPAHQAERLRAEGAEVLLIEDDDPGLDVMSATALPAARERGRRAGRAAS
ncbi:MAG: patatin-like phospholipase family protein, partial [Micropruina sp.]|uniref:patatin-like phospholipase family protein n=1 Tax=Micropruina sp. TaxID=2737536 RepID=UPI0039E25B60